ncbi:MAG: hypothetical protein M3O15_10290 [Acidobacteriota bacterium]|nr:hypothetical protein [Acidobacteriota bacterium]
MAAAPGLAPSAALRDGELIAAAEEERLMGLAPYGEARYVAEVRALVTMGEAGQYCLNLEYFDFLRRDRMYSDRLIELFGAPPGRPSRSFSPSIRTSPGASSG